MTPKTEIDRILAAWPDCMPVSTDRDGQYAERLLVKIDAARVEAAEYRRILQRDTMEEEAAVRKERDVVVGLGWLMIATGRVLATWHEGDAARKEAIVAVTPIALAGASRLFGIDLSKIVPQTPGGQSDQAQAPTS